MTNLKDKIIEILRHKYDTAYSEWGDDYHNEVLREILDEVHKSIDNMTNWKRYRVGGDV
jgi:glutathionyl-hydroquinone reductase